MKLKVKLILFFLITISSLFGNPIANKYPSYSYVFNEFNVDQSYIDNDEFLFFVLKNEKKLRTFYRRSLQRGKDILPTMKNLLVGDGVSDLFIYLSMIESGFSSRAVSVKKAVGLWQFMPVTAKRFNLQICNSNDERCDTSLATTAAIAYLNKLYKQFGKWYLAAMAYNCGEGCVQKALKKAGTDDLSILTDNNLKYLPKETRDYMKKILLVAMIGENNGLDIDSNGNSGSTIEVNIAKGTELVHLARLIKMDYSLLKKLNTGMKDNKIIIPLEKVYAFYLRYELIEQSIEPKPHLISHYVALGETVESIAIKYKSDSEAIFRANHLSDTFLTLGQFLVIPVSKNLFEKTLIGTSK